MKASVWWNNEEALARECEVAKNVAAPADHVVIICAGGNEESIVPSHWVHTDPEIPEGTLCYGWRGKIRPERPYVGYVTGHQENDWLLSSGKVHESGAFGGYEWVDHIEPIELKEPIKWELIPRYYDCLYEMESTRRYGGHEREGYSIGDAPFDENDHIIAIHKRPQS